MVGAGWQRWLRLGLGAGLLLAIAHAIGLGDAGRAIEALPGLCLFHRLTGLDCPGCGMTRAFVCLLRGDLAGAQAMHPFSLLLFCALVLCALLPQEEVERLGRSRLGSAISGVALAALLVWWTGARLLPH